MKSDKKKWSDKNMDEILTSFFQAEVPSRLERPLRLATPAVRSHVPASAVVGAQAPSRWMKVALAGCVAALLLATVAFQLGGASGSSDSPSNGGLGVQPGDTDNEPINVGEGFQDDSDTSVPEQGIELVD